MKKNVRRKYTMRPVRAIIAVVLVLTLAVPASGQAAASLVRLPVVIRPTILPVIMLISEVLGDATSDFINNQLQGDIHPQNIHEKAKAGNVDAQNILGWMYLFGQGVPQDDRQAASWFRRAANQGDARAQATLGWLYRKGRGVPQDDRQAASWFRQAADQGNARAQNALREMRSLGLR